MDQMTTDQKIQVSLQSIDDFKNASSDTFPTPPSYICDHGSLQPASDGLSCMFYPSGYVGVATITAQGTDTNGKQLTGSIQIQVNPGAPMSLGLTAGTPD